jgi:predicted RNA-binding Zn-ribbon protein involved in translation (DUF1610 family)
MSSDNTLYEEDPLLLRVTVCPHCSRQYLVRSSNLFRSANCKCGEAFNLGDNLFATVNGPPKSTYATWDCKNCGQEVIWHGHFVGKPGQEGQLELAMKEYKLGIERKQQALREADKRRYRQKREQQERLRKEWEKANPGHKYENRVKDKIRREKTRNNIGCILCVCMFLYFLYFCFSQRTTY